MAEGVPGDEAPDPCVGLGWSWAPSLPGNLCQVPRRLAIAPPPPPHTQHTSCGKAAGPYVLGHVWVGRREGATGGKRGWAGLVTLGGKTVRRGLEAKL